METGRFIGALPPGERGEAALVGVPFDGTSSHRPGSRFGPKAIREGSMSLETFGPYYDRDLENMDIVDMGDLEVDQDSVERMIEQVYTVVGDILDKNMKPIILGGEHTVTIGVVKRMVEKYPDLVILQLDAHAHSREEYLGDKVSHATVMSRIVELISLERLYRLGVRAGSKEAFIKHGIDLPLGFEGSAREVEAVMKSMPGDVPLYVTLDLDVFDPSLVPGVGNPAPMGMTYREFMQLVRKLAWRNLVGFDVVELAPQYDHTGVSAVVAATAVRDLMMCLM
ncbi:agmatinase [bacterium]|nr:agmatinase [bacterium]